MSRPRKPTTDASLFGIRTSVVEGKKKTCVPIFNQDTITLFRCLSRAKLTKQMNLKLGVSLLHKESPALQF